MRRPAVAAAVLALGGLWCPEDSPAQAAIPLPLPQGATVVTTLSFPEGERESFMNVKEVSPTGTRWTWNLVEIHTQGDTVKQEFAFVESTADVAAAFRILTFHGKEEPIEHPGYTMMAVSRAVYRQLRATGIDSFQVMELAPPANSGPGGQVIEGLLGRQRWVPVRWRGTLSVATPATAPFPVLVNGRRQEVPALHLRGNFAAKGRRFEPESGSSPTAPIPCCSSGSGTRPNRRTSTRRSGWIFPRWIGADRIGGKAVRRAGGRPQIRMSS